MKTRLTIVFMLFCSTGLYSQSTTDYQKLSKACEIWGLIKYFHPDKPGSDFDSAFAANVPHMLKANNESEWEYILTQWLDILDDGSTKVYSSDTIESNNIYKSEFTKDSLLLITISGTKPFEDFYKAFNFFEGIKSQLKNVKNGVIFDLRQTGSISADFEGSINYFFSLIPTFTTDMVPQYKSLYYSGFIPEIGITSGDYSENQVFKNAFQKGGFQKSNKKTAWIVNRYSELPVVALSHQAAGIGIILSDTKNIAEMLPLTSIFNFSDKITISFKTTEIILPNNIQPRINYVYKDVEDPVELSKKFICDWELPSENKILTKRNTSKNFTNYPQDTLPSVGYRVLAAAKIFTVIDTFFPYYNYMDRDWREVFVESLPSFVNAKTDSEYGLAVAKMYANINDSHGLVLGNKGLDQIRGEAPSPVSVDWIENNIVITRLRNDSICQALGINIGDVILNVDGISIDKLMKKYEIYIAHSTKDPIRNLAAQLCIRGPENEESVFTIQNDKEEIKHIKIRYSNQYNDNFSFKYKLDTIALINKEIGYADLTRMESRQTDEMFEKFKNTNAIIFDMRGYPNGTAWSIAPRLTEKKDVPLALFKKPEILYPNLKSGENLSNKSYTESIQIVEASDKWKYKGKTVMLIDHKAISQSEHSGLFFESVNNTTFIGSPTAGANGDVTNFQIPGGITLYFSGQEVMYTDYRQLQRVGLQPHVLVRPTIKGIRAGKDEVLEKAIDWIGENVN